MIQDDLKELFAVTSYQHGAYLASGATLCWHFVPKGHARPDFCYEGVGGIETMAGKEKLMMCENGLHSGVTLRSVREYLRGTFAEKGTLRRVLVTGPRFVENPEAFIATCLSTKRLILQSIKIDLSRHSNEEIEEIFRKDHEKSLKKQRFLCDDLRTDDRIYWHAIQACRISPFDNGFVYLGEGEVEKLQKTYRPVIAASYGLHAFSRIEDALDFFSPTDIYLRKVKMVGQYILSGEVAVGNRRKILKEIFVKEGTGMAEVKRMLRNG